MSTSQTLQPGIIAGTDEAGSGCLAGPVVAAAVILPNPCMLIGLTDSKKLSALKRSNLAEAIKEHSVAWSLGLSWPSEIDRINILQASLKSMVRALMGLKITPEHVLVDGKFTVPMHISQKAIVRGDMLEPCISAASILAKTFRDGLMKSLEKKYPGYGLAKHKGYPTKMHLQSIRRLGPSKIHRRSFKGVLPITRERPLWLINT
ncbi:ribonuclease HII [Desulfonatronovibrio magnus]|uniref:ribonuclease HII n=1 Tax=Desulfonatronovibrio magnus TaxID=698827 RepID=UPI0005EAFE04|nr:ribonuclease HII [Desulfonatronovibrio magnus]